MVSTFHYPSCIMSFRNHCLLSGSCNFSIHHQLRHARPWRSSSLTSPPSSGPLRSNLSRLLQVRPRTRCLPPRFLQEYQRNRTGHQRLEARPRTHLSGQCHRTQGGRAHETVCRKHWADSTGYVYILKQVYRAQDILDLLLIRSGTTRQTIRRQQSALAQEISRVPPRPAQERGSQCRHQGSRHWQLDRQTHPGQPGAQAAETYISCARSCMLLPSIFPPSLYLSSKVTRQ